MKLSDREIKGSLISMLKVLIEKVDLYEQVRNFGKIESGRST